MSFSSIDLIMSCAHRQQNTRACEKHRRGNERSQSRRGVWAFLAPRTCIFSDHKKNNQQKELYLESHPVDLRIRVRSVWMWERETYPACTQRVRAEGERLRIQTQTSTYQAESSRCWHNYHWSKVHQLHSRELHHFLPCLLCADWCRQVLSFLPFEVGPSSTTARLKKTHQTHQSDCVRASPWKSPHHRQDGKHQELIVFCQTGLVSSGLKLRTSCWTQPLLRWYGHRQLGPNAVTSAAVQLQITGCKIRKLEGRKSCNYNATEERPGERGIIALGT